ncbi:MAG: hypothetical protein RLZZ214_1474 [Verrucomicrobiota bacterium]|jgi:hypothetical protein
MKLSLEPHLAGVTGPCPACGSPITAPASKTALPASGDGRSATATPQAPSGRVKRRISADSGIDQSHLERRETAKTLLIFLLFILAICACLLVTWFMKDWIRR